MVLSVRLDEETRRLINRLVRERRLSRSEVVRRGIRKLAEETPSDDRPPFEIIKHLVGSVTGGPPDLSVETGRAFRKLLTDRESRRR